jgi:hypothetical protein
MEEGMRTQITVSKIALIGLLLITSCQSPTGPESSSNLKASYISGKVVDSTNTTVAGAIVLDCGSLALKDTTKSDGSFLLRFNSASSYSAILIAQASGYLNSDTVFVSATPGDTTTTALRLHAATSSHIQGKTRPGSIVLSTVDNAKLALHGTGQNESSLMTFLVSDSLRNPVAGATVKFSVSPIYVDGGSVLPSTAVTDAYGKVSTIYSSGTKSGVFTITASTNNDSLKGSTTIIVNTGLPAFMSLSLKPFNVAGLLYDNLTASIMAILTDRYGNPVPNYPVNFSSTGGTIQTSNYTESIPFTDQKGIVTVSLMSSNDRRPFFGRDTVYAQTVGDTSYRKSDSVIVRSVPVVFSGSTRIIITTPSPLTVLDSDVVAFNYRVQDLNGNPLIGGSEYIVSVTDLNGKSISGISLIGEADVKMSDTQDTSRTSFTAYIIKTSRSSQGGPALFTVTVKSDPSIYGNGSGSSSIPGYINSTSPSSSGGGTTIFGGTPNSLELSGSSTRSVAVNESNNDPTATTALSYTVKDSLGNIITNYTGSGIPRVKVGFSLVPAGGLGGGESLTPAIDSASDGGVVNTVIHAGTKSGIVRVAATLLGTSRPPAYVDVTISGGYPDSNNISLNLSQTNFPPSGGSGAVSVQMNDQYNNPARTGTPVYFTMTGTGGISGNVQTNSSGQTSAAFTAKGSLGNGHVTMTTYGRDSIYIVKRVPFILSGTPIVSVASTNLGTIAAGSSLVVNYKVADVNGNPLASGSTISVTIGGTDGAEAQLTGNTSVTTTDTRDTNTTKYQFTVANNVPQGGTGGSFTVTITVSGSNGTTTQILTGILSSPSGIITAPTKINTVSPLNATIIAAKGTGGVNTASFTFQAVDAGGHAIGLTQSDTMFFSLSDTAGGAYLIPTWAMTDANGQASTKLYAGTKYTNPTITARLKTISTSSLPVRISGPSLTNFNVTISANNLPGLSQIGTVVGTLNAQLGDTSGNPVLAGTIVNFSSTGGSVTGSAVTDGNGSTTVNLYGGSTPNEPTLGGLGWGYITATTQGDNGTILQKKIPFLFSGQPNIQITNVPNDTVIILDGQQNQPLIVTVKDQYGHPLASANTVAASISNNPGSVAITPGSITTPLTQDTGLTQYQFKISDNITGDNLSGWFTIVVAVSGPNGTASHSIHARLLAKQAIIVPPSNTALLIKPVTGQSVSNDIYLTGISVSRSTAITYQIYDAGGNPLDDSRHVTVKFSMLFYGCETTGNPPTIVPDTAITNGNGQVTAMIAGDPKFGQAGHATLIARAYYTKGGIIDSTEDREVAITVHGGVPDQHRFNLGVSQINFPGLDMMNITNDVSVHLFDKCGNPVAPNTAVSFKTSHGGIGTGKSGSSTGVTDIDGNITQPLWSGKPYPEGADSLSIGKAWSYVKAWTGSEAAPEVVDSVRVLWTGRPIITILSGPGSSFNDTTGSVGPWFINVSDRFGNPLSAGTSISVDAGQAEVSGNVPMTMPDTWSKGSGSTDYVFAISKPASVTTKIKVVVTVTVVHPIYGSYKVVIANGTM